MITPMSHPIENRDDVELRPSGRRTAEAGFTLIELMVVLLIIAILLAIAIPTFLGVANSAGDRAAQSNLTNALTEVKALYQNAASYTPAGAAMTPATSRLRLRSSRGCRDRRAPVVQRNGQLHQRAGRRRVGRQLTARASAGRLQRQDPVVLVRAWTSSPPRRPR